MDDNGVADDGGITTERQVGVSEELLGGAEVDDLAGHLQLAKLGGQVSDPTSLRSLVSLAVLVDTEQYNSQYNGMVGIYYVKDTPAILLSC